ncbi:MAG: RNA methyltransferase [Patescibacteria group bacterium]
MEFVAILHNIRSLHNVGSIFRTADAAGVKKIYLGGITPAPTDVFGRVRPQFAKVALGAEKYVKWEKIRHTAEAVARLKDRGYKILAVEQSRRSLPYYRVRPGSRDKVVLLMGAEVKGLPPALLKKCDKILEIPMRGRKESLNVAVAFGIVAYHLFLCESPARYGQGESQPRNK